MQKQLVNVIIANFNNQNLVIDAIKSALNQTYKNISITIIDDCSTDNSVESIYKTFFKSRSHQKYLEDGHQVKKTSDGKIKLIQLKQNVGPAEARNIGIRSSIDETFAYMILDSDDMMLPNKVARMMEVMISSKGIGVVYGDYILRNIETGSSIVENKHSYSYNLLRDKCIVHSNSLVSTDALKSVEDEFGFYDKRLFGPEDYDLWLRIGSKKMIIHIPEILSIVRITGRNISSTSHVDFSKNYASSFKIINEKGYR